jgi:hypothetical protein
MSIIPAQGRLRQKELGFKASLGYIGDPVSKKAKADLGTSEMPVTHACNPSHSGGRDQEDRSSKPAQVHSSQDPISKKPITKKGLVEWLKV